MSENDGTNISRFFLGLGLHAKDGIKYSMERDFFDQGHMSPEWTYDDVCNLLAPYTAIPVEGPRGVRALRKQFQDILLIDIFRNLPETTTITAAALYRRVGDFLDSQANAITVCGGEIFWVREHKIQTDGKYYMEWLGRAISLRLAALHLVPELPIDDLDEFSVKFTPLIKNSNLLVLNEGRREVIGCDLITHKGDVLIEQQQYQVFEYDGQGTWRKLASFAFIDATELVQDLDGPEDEVVPARNTCALLDKILPAEHFDVKKIPGDTGPETWQNIYAHLSSHLQVPYGFSLK